MSKRTASEKEQLEKDSKAQLDDQIEFSDSESESGSASDDDDKEMNENNEEIVNVDFDFFDLDPQIDFLGLKTFLKQLFGDDHMKQDLSGLANIVLDDKNPCVGSSVKTDGKENDPLALISVVNLSQYQTKPPLKSLVDYVLKKSEPKPELYLALKKILAQKGDSVGFIINERIINMPVEITPAMFRFLLEESDKTEPDLKYFILVSKVYKLVESQLSDDSDSESENESGNRKKVKKNTPLQQEYDYFHPEDSILEPFAMKRGVFKYDNMLQETDARRVFTDYGIDPQLSILVFEKSKLKQGVQKLQKSFTV